MVVWSVVECGSVVGGGVWSVVVWSVVVCGSVVCGSVW